jgi:hypothetical protein
MVRCFESVPKNGNASRRCLQSLPGEDFRGPWNEAPDFEYIADPAPGGGMPPAPINPDDEHPVSAKAGTR